MQLIVGSVETKSSLIPQWTENAQKSQAISVIGDAFSKMTMIFSLYSAQTVVQRWGCTIEMMFITFSMYCRVLHKLLVI